MEFAQTVGFSRYISWTPFSIGVLVLGILVIFFGPKKWVLPSFLVLSALMSLALHIVVLGQNLMPHRVFLLCAWGRIIMKGEYRGLQFSRIDKAFLVFCAWMVFTETLQAGGAGFVYAVANNFIDALGAYLLCRLSLREREDLERAIGCLAGICLVIGGCMFLELTIGRNLLTALGAVQDVTQERNGRIRCAASFSIPITAGTFGAVLLPLFIACWWQPGKIRKWAVPGSLACTIITLTSGSASPLSTYIFVIIGMFAWRVRFQMKKIRWGLVALLAVLHMVMKAPVWALIARVQIVPGASAYHRFNVLDTFIRHIGEWWLYGVPSTEAWGWLMDDVANQYCIIAKHGGIFGLFLFLRVITMEFREVGLNLRMIGDDRETGLMIWAFGVLLFAHLTAFFGISYYDQTKIFWYVALALIGSVKLLHLAQDELKDAQTEERAQTPLDFADSLPADAG